MYYCSVGGKNTHGRSFVENIGFMYSVFGINFEGINQEVKMWSVGVSVV